MATIVNLGGELVAPVHAKISVFDRGFLYGDSVYEVLRTYGGRPFAVEPHLDRFFDSALRIGFALPWARRAVVHELTRTLEAAGNEESYIRIVATRGAGEIGLDPALAHDPLLLLIVRELQLPPAEIYARGVKLQIVEILRNLPQAIDPRAKTGNYLNNVLAVAEAKRAGAYEAAMLDAQGAITEGSSSNLFVVKDGRLRTPPLQAGILEGITRAHVLHAARLESIPAEEIALRPDDLFGADEAFLTSSIREVVPVTRVGVGPQDRPIASGEVGLLTNRLRARFRAEAYRSVGLPPPG